MELDYLASIAHGDGQPTKSSMDQYECMESCRMQYQILEALDSLPEVHLSSTVVCIHRSRVLWRRVN